MDAALSEGERHRQERKRARELQEGAPATPVSAVPNAETPHTAPLSVVTPVAVAAKVWEPIKLHAFLGQRWVPIACHDSLQHASFRHAHDVFLCTCPQVEGADSDAVLGAAQHAKLQEHA